MLATLPIWGRWGSGRRMARQQVRIGTRGSPLARVQAEWVSAAIGAHPTEIVVITTSGDRIQDRRLAEIGGKGLFTKEIEEALIAGRIDCAVHSLKDMPAVSPPGLVIAAIPEREDPRDAFVSAAFATLDALPNGARLGTGSLRRAAQALHRRPDLAIVPLRGNVETRLGKLDAGQADAIILAAAGLARLRLTARARAFLDPRAAPPAPGQGALAIQTRAEDAGAPWLAALRHAPTALAVAAERGALAILEGSCRTAIGAYAHFAGAELELTVEALTDDGARRFRRQASIGAPDEATARALGERLGGEVGAEFAPFST